MSFYAPAPAETFWKPLAILEGQGGEDLAQRPFSHAQGGRGVRIQQARFTARAALAGECWCFICRGAMASKFSMSFHGARHIDASFSSGDSDASLAAIHASISGVLKNTLKQISVKQGKIL